MTITIGDCLFGIPMGAMAPGSSGGGGGSYILPPATTSTLGGVIVGDNLEVEDTGEISASVQLKNATDDNKGVEIRYVAGTGGGYNGWTSSMFLASGWNAVSEELAAPYIDFQSRYAGEPYVNRNYMRITAYQDGLIIGPSNENPIGQTFGGTYLGVVRITTSSGDEEAEANKSIVLETRYMRGTPITGGSPSYEVTDSQVVLTDKTGILYRALTNAEYTALETKSVNTMYRITDTGKVYLGETDISGGGGAVMTTQAGLGLGAENTGYVGTTTVTVTNPDEEVV